MIPMKQHHPIEIFIVACLYLVEAICYCINHLAGWHKQVIKVQPMINPLFADLNALTVKQLKALLGLKSTKLRKPQLIELYFAY